MVTKEAIDAALSAHAQWKKRLEDALSTGKSEFKVDVVQKDNACQFGQWLNGLPPQDTRSEDFNKVKTLHADFHKTAADILSLALSGKKEEAATMLAYSGKYSYATGKLVLALQAWKSKL